MSEILIDKKFIPGAKRKTSSNEAYIKAVAEALGSISPTLETQGRRNRWIRPVATITAVAAGGSMLVALPEASKALAQQSCVSMNEDNAPSPFPEHLARYIPQGAHNVISDENKIYLDRRFDSGSIAVFNTDHAIIRVPSNDPNIMNEHRFTALHNNQSLIVALVSEGSTDPMKNILRMTFDKRSDFDRQVWMTMQRSTSGFHDRQREDALAAAMEQARSPHYPRQSSSGTVTEVRVIMASIAGDGLPRNFVDMTFNVNNVPVSHPDSGNRVALPETSERFIINPKGQVRVGFESLRGALTNVSHAELMTNGQSWNDTPGVIDLLMVASQEQQTGVEVLLPVRRMTFFDKVAVNPDRDPNNSSNAFINQGKYEQAIRSVQGHLARSIGNGNPGVSLYAWGGLISPAPEGRLNYNQIVNWTFCPAR